MILQLFLSIVCKIRKRTKCVFYMYFFMKRMKKAVLLTIEKPKSIGHFLFQPLKKRNQKQYVFFQVIKFRKIMSVQQQFSITFYFRAASKTCFLNFLKYRSRCRNELNNMKFFWKNENKNFRTRNNHITSHITFCFLLKIQ